MPSHAKKTSHKKLTRYQHRIKIIENQLHRDGFFQEKSLTAIFAIVVEGLNDAGLNVADRHKLILMKFINESKCHHYSLKKQLSEKVLSYLLQQFNEDKLTEAYLRGLFSYIDENGLTLGHRLMRHGDEKSVSLYLSILEALIQKNDKNLDLLKLTDKDDNNLGQCINDFKATSHYLTMLSNAITHDKITEALELLLHSNDEGNDLEHLLVLHFDIFNLHHYMQLLLLLIDKGRPLDVIQLLSAQNKAGNTMAHLLMSELRFKDQYVILFFKTLDKLMTEKNNDEVIDLFFIQNTRYENMGHLIASCQSESSMLLYLDFLAKLIQSGQPDKVFFILSQQDKNGWNLGRYLTSQKNNVLIQQYCHLLKSLSAEDALHLLLQAPMPYATVNVKTKNQVDWVTAEVILEHNTHKNAEITNATRIARESSDNRHSKELTPLAHSKFSINFGSQLAHYKAKENAPSIDAYLSLLEHLIKGNQAEGVMTLLRQEESNGWNLRDMIAKHHDRTLLLRYRIVYGKAIVKILQHQEEQFVNVKDYRLLLKHKGRVKEYFTHLTLYEQDGDKQQIESLKETCNNKETPLGTYCYTLRGVGKYFHKNDGTYLPKTIRALNKSYAQCCRQ